MSTTPLNRIVRSVRPASIFESAKDLIGSSTSYNQGDLLVLDLVTHKIRPMQALDDFATIGMFLGIATETVVNGKLKQPYTTDVDASQAIADLPGPVYGVVAKMKLVAGQTINPGDQLTGAVDVDAQTVTGTLPVGTNPICIYQGPAIVAAAAGTQIEVLLGQTVASGALSF